CLTVAPYAGAFRDPEAKKSHIYLAVHWGLVTWVVGSAIASSRSSVAVRISAWIARISSMIASRIANRITAWIARIAVVFAKSCNSSNGSGQEGKNDEKTKHCEF